MYVGIYGYFPESMRNHFADCGSNPIFLGMETQYGPYRLLPMPLMNVLRRTFLAD